MQPIKVYSVTAKLPPSLEGLWDLAYNLWYSWNADVQDVFTHIDAALWKQSGYNPVWFINNLPQSTVNELANDVYFKERLAEAVNALRQYCCKPSIFRFSDEGVGSNQPSIAYFSLEFGICLSLPIYSGGLGILAGDHLKSASDLNIPLVGMGLAYQQGYFRQYLTPDAWQQERYTTYDFEQMPMRHALTPEGERAYVHMNIGDRDLTARIWEVKVGRIKLYLFDTDIPENPDDFKPITARLYSGNLEMRLWQEMLLGIGGVKAFKVLGIDPKVIHMNEGHSAFAAIERVCTLMRENGLPFEAAAEVSASGSIFTTHTPVPAGNDRFSQDLIYKYMEGYARNMGLAMKTFMALGREDPYDDTESFCMPVLALRFSRSNNGVSILHGRVSRDMWKRVWNQFPVEDVPIGAITNGVHAPFWVAEDMAILYDRYLGTSWRDDPDCTRAWSQVDTISDAELWRTHERLRARLVDFVRERLRKQLVAQGARKEELRNATFALDPEVLTIGFARRFATYKRANLLLREKERLLQLLANNERPIQFIIAGKAHPADQEGKQLIKELVSFSKLPEANMRIVFVEDYDIEVAGQLVAGCDIWLNNPRRPHEACGTSGMKAMLNGVLQFSTLDGWWDEAYLKDNSVGWAIGKGEEYTDLEYQDFVEVQTLFTILENDIIPEFYDRGRGNVPRAWVQRMKKALQYLAPRFTSHRMVYDYYEQSYVPAHDNYMHLAASEYTPAKALAEWRMGIMRNWGGVRITDVHFAEGEVPKTTIVRPSKKSGLFVGQAVTVTAKVFLSNISTDNLKIEVYAGPLTESGAFKERQLALMQPHGEPQNGWQDYQAVVGPHQAGRFGFTVRALPVHPLLPDSYSLGLISWAEQ